jgi:OFA family oxalate/formate antiporter-like MFS transporter
VGFGYAWSVLLKPLAGGMGWSAADVSLSFTALMTMGAVAAIVVGKAQQCMQPRTLTLIGGALFGVGMVSLGSVHSLGGLYAFAALAGLGMGTVYPGGTMSNAIRFFPDRRGLASGLLTAGYGLGAVVWAPVAVLLIDAYGLSWAFRILGAVFFVIVAACSVMVRTAPEGYAPAGRTPPQETTRIGRVADLNWTAMMRTQQFAFLSSLFVVGSLSGMMVIGHASPIAQEILKISPTAAGAVVSYLALGMVLGKVVWGIVSDRIGRNAVFGVLFVIATVALLVLSSTSVYVTVVLCVAAVGLCYGGFLSLMGPVTADAFGATYLGVNFGIMFFTVAISAFLGPRVAAMVTDRNGGDYSIAFIIAAVINIMGLALLVCHVLLTRRRAAYLKTAKLAPVREGGHAGVPESL